MLHFYKLSEDNYFAVDEKRRGSGVGSLFLSQLTEYWGKIITSKVFDVNGNKNE